MLKEKDQALDERFTNLNEEIQEKRNKITQEQEKAKAHIKPEMDKIEGQINELTEHDKKLDGYMIKEQENQNDNNDRKELILAEMNAHREEIALKEEEIAKIKDEPHRLEKGALILEDSLKSLDKSFKENEDLIKEKNRYIADQVKELDRVKASYKEPFPMIVGSIEFMLTLRID